MSRVFFTCLDTFISSTNLNVFKVASIVSFTLLSTMMPLYHDHIKLTPTSQVQIHNTCGRILSMDTSSYYLVISARRGDRVTIACSRALDMARLQDLVFHEIETVEEQASILGHIYHVRLRWSNLLVAPTSGRT